MPNIVQRIALEGGAAVVSALQAIGTAGQKAMSQIQVAANAVTLDRVTNQLRNVGTNLKTLGSQFGDVASKLAAVFGVTLTAGAGGFAVSLLQVARAGTEAADAIDDLASDIGSTAEEVQALQSVFVETGVNTEGLGEKFRRLAVNTQEAWNTIRDSVRNAADLVKKDHIGIEESSISLAQAQINLRKAFADPALGGDDLAKKEQALLNVRSARVAVDRALLAQSEARKKAQDDEANTVENLKNNINALASGQKAQTDVNLSAEKAFLGLVAAAGQESGALQKVEGNFYDLASRSGPGLNAIVTKMADLFKNLQDGSLKTAIAVKAFGRGVDHDMIEALSKGSPAFIKLQNELKRLGLSFDEVDIHVANTFKESYNKLANYITLIKNRIGVDIAPAAEQLIRIITNVVTSNIDNIRLFAVQVADYIRGTLTPAVQAFANVVTGVSFEDFKNSAQSAGLTVKQVFAVQEWQERFQAFKETAVGVFTVIKAAVMLLVGALDLVAEGINKIAGTHLSGESLGVALLILQFTGLLRVILLVGQAIYNLGVLIGQMVILAIQYLAPLLGWPALAIAAFALLIAAIIIYWNDIQKLSDQLVNYLADGFNNLIDKLIGKFKAFGEFVAGIFKAIGAGIKSAFDAMGQAALAQSQAEGGGGLTFAEGGAVRGPGTGTSDSIIARVSTGEYVVRAAAVRHWGGAFMDAVNSAPGYAMGGLVDTLRAALAPMAVPRLAAGGTPGAGLRPFTLVMPGGGSFGGLYAEGGTVTQLRRAAVHAQVSSTGRKPSWVR